MHNKICEFCGKPFKAEHGKQKYCSELCKMKAHGDKDLARKAILRELKRQTNPPKNDTLCWKCKNACGGCSWSKNLTPVEGWKAERVYNNVYSQDTVSYRVRECPEFERGR